MIKGNKRDLVFVSVCITLLFAKIGIASNCPIIFIHGHKSDPTDTTGWKTWRNPQSAMQQILHNYYAGYSAGNPLECNENTALSSTGGQTRKIYSFSYYCHDGDSGAIGSNGVLRCSKLIDRRDGRWYPRENVPPQFAVDLYAGVVNNNSWAEKLAQFIDKVRTATGSPKVDIVAHSMGGLVARSAIKYYNCASKVRKLLMIGTPNHPYQHSFGEWIYDTFSDDKPWQKYGEDFEMDVDVATGGHGINFETSDPQSDAPWCDHLGYENLGVQMATIAGNKGLDVFLENDGVVAVSQVKMGSSAEFEPTIYASHSYDWAVENRLDSTLDKPQKKNKTGAIIAEFFGASIGQAGLGLGFPYILTKSIPPSGETGKTIEASITFLALYSVGAPIGASLGCIGTGKILGQQGRTFGSVFVGAVIGEAVGWGIQLLMAKIGNESLIFFFLPVSIGAVVSYNKSNTTYSKFNNYKNLHIEKSFVLRNYAMHEYVKKISAEFLEIKF